MSVGSMGSIKQLDFLKHNLMRDFSQETEFVMIFSLCFYFNNKWDRRTERIRPMVQHFSYRSCGKRQLKTHVEGTPEILKSNLHKNSNITVLLKSFWTGDNGAASPP